MDRPLRDELALALRLAESAISDSLRSELLDIAARLSEELIQFSLEERSPLNKRAGSPVLRLVKLASEYVCMSKDVIVGTIEPQGDMWHWQTVGVEVHVCGTEPDGVAQSLDAAHQALSESWNAWLAAAGVIERIAMSGSVIRTRGSHRRRHRYLSSRR